MIELNFKGICEDCKCADLEVNSIYAETIGGSKYKKNMVRKMHTRRCLQYDREKYEERIVNV